MLSTPDAIGAEIVRHWQPVFSQRQVHTEVKDMFFDVVQPQAVLAEWAWPEGQWR